MAKIPKVNMSLYVPKETRRVIEHLAGEWDDSMSGVVERIITSYLTGVPPVVAQPILLPGRKSAE